MNRASKRRWKIGRESEWMWERMKQVERRKVLPEGMDGNLAQCAGQERMLERSRLEEVR